MTTPNAPTVYLLAADKLLTDELAQSVRALGYHAKELPHTAAYEERGANICGCLVAASEPGATLKLLSTLRRQRSLLPLIAIGDGISVREAIALMQAGAVTVLETPVRAREFAEAIELGVESTRRAIERSQRLREINSRLASLTSDERFVLNRLVDGIANKNVASELGVSLRTIENRRSRIFRKLQAETLAELVRMVVESEALAEEEKLLYGQRVLFQETFSREEAGGDDSDNQHAPRSLQFRTAKVS